MHTSNRFFEECSNNHGLMNSEANPESKCYLCVEIILEEW